MKNDSWFQSRPVKVRACRIIELGVYPDWINQAIKDDKLNLAPLYRVFDELHTTWVSFKVGDWIIEGTKNELYPCVHEVFIEKYAGYESI